MIPFGNSGLFGNILYGTGQWDPSYKSASITLTDNNTRATSNNGADDGLEHLILGATGRQSGKYHLEIGVLAATNANAVAGLATVDNALNPPFSSFGDGIVFGQNGSLTLNADDGGGATIILAANSPLVWGAGSRLVFEVDFSTWRLWVTRVTGGAPAPWNNNGSANPATGVGGLDISRITGGTGSIALRGAAMGRIAPDSFLSYFNGNFIVPLSSGFSNWG